MTSLQFILFVIPFIFGSLCETRMENDMKIHLSRMEQRFDQQIHILQQKHENSLSHLQTHILNLEKENKVLQSKFKLNVEKLESFENEIKKINREKHLFKIEIENRLSVCENKFQWLYEDVAKNKKFIKNKDIIFNLHVNQQNETNTLYPSIELEVQNTPDVSKIYIHNDHEDVNTEELLGDQNSVARKTSELQEEDVSFKQQIIELKQQQMEEQQKVSIIYEQMKKTLDQGSTFVSFTAYAAEYSYCNADDILLFDGIVSNYGGYYNQTNSIFTCPFSGYYLFSVNVLASGGHRMAVNLRIDGDIVIGTYARDADTLDHASLTTVQFCQQGAPVSVRCIYDGDLMVGDDRRYSSFTGTLLRIV